MRAMKMIIILILRIPHFSVFISTDMFKIIHLLIYGTSLEMFVKDDYFF